ncbi:unnamed protein product, partial [Rotaria socialis]
VSFDSIRLFPIVFYSFDSISVSAAAEPNEIPLLVAINSIASSSSSETESQPSMIPVTPPNSSASSSPNTNNNNPGRTVRPGNGRFRVVPLILWKQYSGWKFFAFFPVISDQFLPESTGTWQESTGKVQPYFRPKYCLHIPEISQVDQNGPP